MPRRWRIFVSVGLVSLIVDVATKVWARASLPVSEAGVGQPVDVIANFFQWRLSYNTGSAFGLFGSMDSARVFLSLIGVAAVGAMVWMVRSARDDQRRLAWALGLIVGGAIGNLIDRIYSGKVTDFIVWRYYDKEWPTFNVADIVLVVGVGLLALDMIAEERRRKREAKTDDVTDDTAAPARKNRPPSKRKGGKSKRKRR